MSNLSSDDLPVPSKRTVGRNTSLKREKKKLLTELAAMTYVAMEMGDWVYSPGTRVVLDDSGDIVPNKSEVMRRAGYRGKTVERFNETLEKDEYFWEMVELYRIRRTDPNFRADHVNTLYSNILEGSLRQVYETVTYMPHSLTIDQHLKVIKTLVDAGVVSAKAGDTPAMNRTNELLDKLDPVTRDQTIAAMKQGLTDELKSVESLERAHRGADHEQGV